MSRFFKSQFESYLNINAKNDYLDKKVKERKLRMERCLYHYRVANEDAQNSYEHTICLKSYLISKNCLNSKMQFPNVMDGNNV
jgi:hypothetical protein